MGALKMMFDMIGPGPLNASEVSATERWRAAVFGFLCAVAFAAVWGIAAGSRDGHLALANLMTVPILLTASSVAALPVGLLLFRLTSSDGRLSDLMVGHAAATFTGTLVLAVLSPIVALFQHSSLWAGSWVALGSVFVALVVAVAILIRVVAKLSSAGGARRAVIFPFVVLGIVQLSSLLQLASVMPPVFPDRTVFGHGIDALGETEPRTAPSWAWSRP
jgi:hypothetical protein